MADTNRVELVEIEGKRYILTFHNSTPLMCAPGGDKWRKLQKEEVVSLLRKPLNIIPNMISGLSYEDTIRERWEEVEFFKNAELLKIIATDTFNEAGLIKERYHHHESHHKHHSHFNRPTKTHR